MDFHGKTIRLPADVAEEVRYVANNSRHGFTADAIPGDLDVAGRLLLVKTLLQEGFLTLVDRITFATEVDNAGRFP